MTRTRSRSRSTAYAIPAAVITAAFVAVVLLNRDPAPTAPDPTAPATATPPGEVAGPAHGGLGAVDLGIARAQLATLTIAPEDTTNPYDRAAWGERWSSHGNSCDTREVVLRDQGTGWVDGPECRPTCPPTGPACWVSVYDNAAVYDPHQLQIDHLVPVAEANRSGTRDWTPDQRHAYYQDTDLLVAVTATSNRAKSDGDPAVWRPTDTGAWCWYAARWVQIKTTYRLTADPAERTALGEMLTTCEPNR